MTSLEDVLPGIVDAHVQHWNPRRTPWAATRASRFYGVVPSVADRVFPLVVSRADREYVLTPRTVARAYEPRQYATDAALVPTVVGVPIDSVVHVESHWRKALAVGEESPELSTAVEETRYLESLPFGWAGTPRLGAIVAHGDPRAPGFPRMLDEQFEVSERVRGIRLVASRHPDPRVRDGGDSDSILSSTPFLEGFADLAHRDLVFEAAVYSHQLYDVILLAREYPQTTIVLDHFGIPAGVFGPIGVRTGATAASRADIWRLWRERMTTLASHRNVVVKLSGLAMPVLGYGRERWGNIGGQSTLTEMIGPFVEHVVTHFGSDRIMFGSNYPIDRPNAAVDVLVGALVDCVSQWGPDALRKIFRDTAVRVYGIDGAGPTERRDDRW
ncbi:amidohydrolase family protein [Gordonia sp. zg691]|uniref:Amidohydrolase family protein n=1 Tax=Gordonia jinghuaiqii TaxID=2758710 RepID=A0A7D7QWM3_9ACTN|nr:amidohydrolase family protein [Gordonia jinghuaiqii]MBD0863675.1 amidohydrolase family protein [Gordonia jinghuaiqii]MCR5979408.1 amidohydrolase family protein [Gordonia jinghuaiqii]QMT01189.1 amidohydrolase family protein [Gordonia jinghuaiqii]